MCNVHVVSSKMPGTGSLQITPAFSILHARNSTCFLSSRICFRQYLLDGIIRSPHLTPPSVKMQRTWNDGFGVGCTTPSRLCCHKIMVRNENEKQKIVSVYLMMNHHLCISILHTVLNRLPFVVFPRIFCTLSPQHHSVADIY